MGRGAAAAVGGSQPGAWLQGDQPTGLFGTVRSWYKSPGHRDCGSNASNLRMFSKQISPGAGQPPQKQTQTTTGRPWMADLMILGAMSRATPVSRFLDMGSRDSAGVSSRRSRWEVVQVGGAEDQV